MACEDRSFCDSAIKKWWKDPDGLLRISRGVAPEYAVLRTVRVRSARRFREPASVDGSLGLERSTVAAELTLSRYGGHPSRVKGSSLACHP